MTVEVESPKSTPLSFRDLAPLEEGGPAARAGYRYQDHVAAAKCLEMMWGSGPSEVWCEAEDDVVLVWVVDGIEVFEFVQVKSDDLERAWSISRLCERTPSKDGKTPGRCIVEKSLAHHRGAEECCFRVVTCWRPSKDLEVLTLPREHEARAERLAEMIAAATQIEGKLGECTSPNGGDITFWTLLTVWEFRPSSEDLQAANLLLLEQLLASADLVLAFDQRVDLYERLLARVQQASEARWSTHRHEKRFVRDELRAWIVNKARSILRPANPGTTTTLVRKLAEAGVETSSVENAKEARRRYLAARRESKYLSIENDDEVEDAIQTRLHFLKTRLDAREFSDDGLQFHSRCLKELVALRNSLSEKARPPESYVFGCMYEVMNRCLHRLVRHSP